MAELETTQERSEEVRKMTPRKEMGPIDEERRTRPCAITAETLVLERAAPREKEEAIASSTRQLMARHACTLRWPLRWSSHGS